MQDSSRVRFIAAAAAAIGWAGLTLQLALIIRNLGIAEGLWRYIGFFTILTNLGAAAVMTAIAARGGYRLAGPRARLMAAVSMLIVGLVYSVALRSTWNPTGLQKLADVMLHDAAPVTWLVFWLLADPPRYAWKDIGWALLPPFLYCVYALARGAADGWYAYWFLDPTRQGIGGLTASIAVMIAGFALVAAGVLGYARWRSARPVLTGRDPVDEASRESFPASDPPSWTLGEDRRR